MKELLRLGCLVLLASGSIQVGAAHAAPSRSAHPSASASAPSKISEQRQDAKSDAKLQRGVAMHDCRSMHGDEKRHCQEQAARIAHSVYREGKPTSAPN